MYAKADLGPMTREAVAFFDDENELHDVVEALQTAFLSIGVLWGLLRAPWSPFLSTRTVRRLRLPREARISRRGDSGQQDLLGHGGFFLRLHISDEKREELARVILARHPGRDVNFHSIAA